MSNIFRHDHRLRKLLTDLLKEICFRKITVTQNVFLQITSLDHSFRENVKDSYFVFVYNNTEFF